MKSGLILLIIVASIIVILLFRKTSKKYTTVKINDVSVRAEISESLIERSKGLMFKKSLPDNEGMLFVFDKEGYHRFWMMNMSFPIDIIWIDNEKKVVHIVKDAKPCGLICNSYAPEKEAKYVLEVNANFTTKNKINVDTKVIFTL